MNKSSRHSNSNFAHHIVFIDPFTVCRLKEKPLRQINIFRKIGKAMEVKRVSKI